MQIYMTFEWLMLDLCLKDEAYTVCVARLFLRVAPVGSLL